MAAWAQPLLSLRARHHSLGSGDGFACRRHLPTSLPPNPIRGRPTLPRHPIAQTARRGTGILTRCPSPTTFILGLGPTNPTRIDLASETLGLRRTRFSRVLRYSCPHSHFCSLQPSFRSTFLASRTLPYRPPGPQAGKTHGFGAELEPRYIIRAGPLDQ